MQSSVVGKRISETYSRVDSIERLRCDGKWEMDNSIEHFGDKLVKLEGMMKTATGKEMARVRTERLNIFAGWWQEEMSLASGYP